MGLRPEKGCTGDAQQKLKTADPTYRQIGHLTSTVQKIIKERRRKIGCWSLMSA
jgi:hypothetical protein